MNNTIFVLNAPKRCGKDTAARFMQTYCEDMRSISFKDPIFNVFLATTGMDQYEFHELYATDDWKDEPQDFLGGKTVRDMLIHISENFIKPFYGDDYYGVSLAKMLMAAEDKIGQEVPWVIPDCGFDSEVDALVELLGSRVVVVQFHREGFTDFGSDSRDWVTTDSPRYHLEQNNGENGSHEDRKSVV